MNTLNDPQSMNTSIPQTVVALGCKGCDCQTLGFFPSGAELSLPDSKLIVLSQVLAPLRRAAVLACHYELPPPLHSPAQLTMQNRYDKSSEFGVFGYKDMPYNNNGAYDVGNLWIYFHKQPEEPQIVNALR